MHSFNVLFFKSIKIALELDKIEYNKEENYNFFMRLIVQHQQKKKKSKYRTNNDVTPQNNKNTHYTLKYKSKTTTFCVCDIIYP